MTFSDETLMAFADGELDAAAHRAVESAMRSDPELERRVARHRALRLRLQEAFGAELSEPVPERLIMAARKSPPLASAVNPSVVNLESIRQAGAARRAARAATWPWWQLGSMAASLAVGLGIGFLAWQGGSQSMLREAQGALVAEGHLANVLTSQLAAGRDSGAGVQVGITFLAKSGDYCRTFSTGGPQSAVGLACRSGRNWQIQALLQSGAATSAEGGYRTAGSAMPAQILHLVEAQIVGEPLDREGEAAALAKQWQSKPR